METKEGNNVAKHEVHGAKKHRTPRVGQSSRRVHTNNRQFSDLREQAAVVGRDVRELASVGMDSVCAQLNPVQEYVREKPIQSLLIAAGLGAVFGLLFLRR